MTGVDYLGEIRTAELAATNSISTGTGRAPIGQLARDIEPEHVTWVWPGRLAAGKVSVFDGDPGLGKSTQTLDIAARISRGALLPGCATPSKGQGVVILSAEDGAADTIVPRLRAAAANLDRVFILQGVRSQDGNEDAVTLPGHLSVVEQAITDVDAALLIVDPLMAYLGADTNAHRDQDVRRALAPLAAMLERTSCAGLLIRHLNKGQAGSALYRGGGSIGIIGAARFGLLVARDPDDDEARILAPTKCNIGPHPQHCAFD
jgi:RecA-family ATPase